MLSRSTVAATLPFNGLKAARDFYSKKLGLRLEEGSIKKGYLSFAAGKGTVLHVFESDSTKSDDTAATFHVADLEKEMKALRKKGVVFEEYDLPQMKTVAGVATRGREKAAWLKDPGGNVICLHQKR
jgi:catechol-2,3-dioxygenase